MTVNERARTKNEINLESEKQVMHNNDQENNAFEYDGDSQTFSIYSEVPRIAWDWICWSGAKTFDGMDFAGEVLANFLGLNQSKYQWIIDAQVRQEEEKQQRRLERSQQRQLRLEQLLEEEQRKLQELEIGVREQEPTTIDTFTTV
ncbi:hypothetical protein F442_13961 [Phytophthora nicotianae P10297]|uniref:Uncharacterized protein n=5 Tax=Phytophthora nicotianae TaxID=4792 RepID=W2PW65_PHYN3|nr:hypothetical protein PPTG_14812 [Phytophthora nicotianae INRA-310]ETI40494.1 hypothetical protein F443_14116 [Phytophthora nicotianae P1569]ETL87295.1 hypothetical protein L917_13464 [Phytophthora nicotianae]ETO69227.1 hypothetical protein F444_14146 [Phytophthora nicotianae P1976]ETP38410.1 hypothetical protein F442_13961 [Phytophthora nicotianae P10297]ETN05152.1 hypothetical protein PPTG_14812 [Phytophthora nicotianae INRA-310]